MQIGFWGQSMWLSNRDMNQAAERSIEAENVPFAVVNLVSNNPGMRWDIEHTRKVIGYVPEDGNAPVLEAHNHEQDAKAKTVALPPGTWFNEHFDAVDG
jgi:NAD+ dependent glucose-6-phosphate dehydrogenase